MSAKVNETQIKDIIHDVESTHKDGSTVLQTQLADLKTSNPSQYLADLKAMESQTKNLPDFPHLTLTNALGEEVFEQKTEEAFRKWTSTAEPGDTTPDAKLSLPTPVTPDEVNFDINFYKNVLDPLGNAWTAVPDANQGG
jgi:hypothetical protein